RMFGSESTSAPTDPSGAAGRAKSSARALLLRDFSGYVLTSERSNSSYGKIISAYRKIPVGADLQTGPASGRPQRPSPTRRSEGEHSTAVSVEPVALGDGRIICVSDTRAPGEG